MIRRAVVAIGLAAAVTARADAPPRIAAPSAPSGPPDPAAIEAGDANLESTAERSGLTFAAAIGGGFLIGFGIKDSVGRGGAVSLRLGHVATPRTVLTFEADVAAALHRPASTATMSRGLETNTDTSLLAGAQYYVNPSLWLRCAGGAGVYQGRQVAVSSVELGNVTRIGPAMVFGAGVDLARFKWAVLGIEIGTSAMINGDGVLLASSLSLGLAFD
jgi:hypothetical protein